MNKEIELLAPAGSYEAFIAAIQNGANAIYLGGNQFSARAHATNFSRTEIQEAIYYAHLRNVKIYVTINTLYQEEQYQELYEYISFLYHSGVDAIIVQDVGVLTLVQEYFPDLETHMSTQASIYSLEGVQYFEDRGIKRVVLSRENTLEEIAHICKHSNIDIEVFVHGAQCVSYSGQCLMSSFIGKRSGNKGSCAQPCRLGYTLEKDHKIINQKDFFLLSPKDLCTIQSIGKLIDAGVTSFKIEGRMKRPEYVATIIKSYRKAIDAHLKKQKVDINTEIKTMKKLFNRGFTGGYILHDKNFMAKDYSGNRGLEVGTVLHYHPKTQRVSIKLSMDVKQNDKIVFKSKDISRTITKIYKDNKLVNKGLQKEIIEIEMNERIPKKDIVYKVIDSDMLEIAQKSYEKENIKVPLTISFVGKIGNPCTLTISDGKHTVTKETEAIVEVARNQPLSKERIKQQLEKLGNTIYISRNTNIDFPTNGNISVKELNVLRRESIDSLNILRTQIKNINIQIPPFKPLEVSTTHTISGLAIKVSTLVQLQVAVQYPHKYLFFPITKDLEEAFVIAKKHNTKLIPYTDFMMSNKALTNFINSNIYQQVDTVLIGNHGALKRIQKEKHCMLDTTMNIYNSYASTYYKDMPFICSLEMSKKQVQQLQTNSTILYPVYGYVESMFSKYCPISEQAYGKKIEGCNICKKGEYALIDRKQERFTIRMDDSCFMHLYNSKPLYIDTIKNINADAIVLNFTIENAKETDLVLKDYCYRILQNKKSQYKTKILYTKGYCNG